MSAPADPDRRFQLLVESITQYAVYMLDPEGRVMSWNSGAARVKGYTAEEIEGESFSRFFTLEDRRAGVPESLLAQARDVGRTSSEGWRLRKDGSRFWAQASLHAMRDDDGSLVGFAKITRDMTEQREAQQALIDSERRFRLFVEGVVDYAMYMLDPDGTVTNWNRGAQRIKGYLAPEIVGRHFSHFYTPEDRRAGKPARALLTALKDGRFESEGWRLRKDGSRFWANVVIDPIYDETGRHIGYAKITRDISERRAAQEALAESERQFRLLVGGVVDYALYMLDPNGIVTNWNAGAEQIKGYMADEIVGQHFSRFYTESERAAGMPTRALNIAREQGRYEAEGWRVRKDGSLFFASVVIDAIRDEKGQLIGFAKITRDITEKRQAQQELQRAQDQLAQAQKMEALGQLTGGVAHDFNNLLMVVSGQAQLLRRKVGDDVRAHRALDAIETSAQRGEDLTRHLLSFARRQRLQPVAIALNERLGALKDLVSAGLPANIGLSVELRPDLWPVEVDLSELELGLLNLAVNARDAMPAGGTLSIHAENIPAGSPQTPEGLSGDFVALTVADTGVGIPDDILPKVFDPFFTTKEVNKGTGLGLSQVYGFARQLGGTATVRSELGRGTNVTLYLPRTGAAPQPADAPQEPAPQAKAARILVVEDNPEVAEVAAALLEQLGHTVQLVGNTRAALTALQDAERPDLVFTDVVMAGDMDGVDLARDLRDRYPDLPVLLATGYSQAVEGIGDEFPILRKPYRIDELNRAVSTLLANPPDPHGGKLVRIDRAREARNGRRSG
ncbi:MAG TPA: PAS domain S-box protein [Phenylobacterium sp.]